jgi:RNA polymerase sigma factor (sigma-70 family)
MNSATVRASAQTMKRLRDDVPALEVAAEHAESQAKSLSESRKDLEERFIRFVAERRERARRLAWRLVGGHDASADDVVQEAFLKAYRGLGKFRDRASLDTWFYRILLRQAQSQRRWRALRDLWNGETSRALETVAAPGRDIDVQRRIAAALARLSAPQRQSFVLVHLEGFTVDEAATIMGKAAGTVKSHLHRALSRLRLDLADLARPGAKR